jgi:hypothetical protein
MQKKLIHSDFEIELSNLKTTETQENAWFSDRFSSKVSLPFQLDLTDEKNEELGFISLHNTSPETLLKVKYVNENEISDAELEIQESEDNMLQCVYEFGFEDFPSWDKKLSELSLEEFDLPADETIYEHALTVIGQTWPDVNYNFHAVHVNHYDTDDSKWAYFQNVINKMESGAFLENYSLHPAGEFHNINVMQPIPYSLHILQRGIADGGFTLAGDILSDPELQRETMFCPVEKYYGSRTIEEYSLLTDNTQYYSVWYTSTDGRRLGYYVRTFNIPVWGYYSIVGTVKAYKLWPGDEGESLLGAAGGCSVVFNGVEILNLTGSIAVYDEFIIDTVIQTVPGDLNLLTVLSYSDIDVEALLHDIQILTIQQFYPDGTPIPQVINESKVNLKKVVPDMTFGDHVTRIRNQYNYGFTPVGKLIYMNKIEDEINFSDPISFEEFEVKHPARKFQQGMSFNLKFKDTEIKDYNYLQIFHDKHGYTTGSFVPTAKTKMIEINALPLPIVEKGGLTTAFCFENSDAKPYLILYDGLTAGKNIAKDPTPILIPAVHDRYYKKWFQFRINAQAFHWSFKTFSEKLIGFDIRKKIFAYGNFHIVKSITKTEFKPGQIDVDIETESIK